MQRLLQALYSHICLQVQRLGRAFQAPHLRDAIDVSLYSRIVQMSVESAPCLVPAEKPWMLMSAGRAHSSAGSACTGLAKVLLRSYYP